MMQVNLCMNTSPKGCNRSAQNTFYLTFKHSLWVRKSILFVLFIFPAYGLQALSIFQQMKQANLIIDSTERASSKSQPASYSGDSTNSIKDGELGCAPSQEVCCTEYDMAHETAFYTDVTFIG